MQKKVSLSTLIISVVCAILVTFLITAVVFALGGTVSDIVKAVKAADSVGEEIDTLQENLPEDKRNPELFKTLAYIDYFYQSGYVGEVDNEDLQFYLMNAYIAYVGDKYGMYYTPEMVDELFSGFQGVSVGIGVYIKGELENGGIKVFATMKDSPAETAGILAGEYITKVDGVLVSTLGYDEAVSRISGEIGADVTLTVENASGEVREVELTRREYETQSVYYRKYSFNDSIGVIRIIDFTDSMPSQFKDAVNALIAEGCTSLVFDVRSNGGGTLDSCVEVLDFLLPEGPVAYITDSEGNVENTYYSDESEIDLPMVVLTDGYTASAAELFTCALKDYDKATIIGTKTYGKGCMQNVFELPCGGALRYTTNMFNGPVSPNFDGVGISPDITASLYSPASEKNLFELTDTEDNQLHRAYIYLINKESN